MYTIYALKDPRTDAVRYVGATQLPLFVRLGYHLNDICSDRKQSPRVQWLRELVDADLEPDIVELATLLTGNSREAGRLEQGWIEHFKEKGCDLLNVRRGGGGLSSAGRGGPSAWAICKFSKVPDRAIAEHEGVHVATVARWRKEQGYMSYSEKIKLFSSICPEVTMVASTWDSIVKERMQLEARGIPGCSVYEGWIERLEKSTKLTRGVKLIRDEGLEEAIAAYCRSLIGCLKSDKLLTGHESIMGFFELWDSIQEEREVYEGEISLDDFDIWIGQLAMYKRSVNSDVFQYDHVMDVLGRFIEKFREERTAHEVEQADEFSGANISPFP